MLMVCHDLNPAVPVTLAFAESGSGRPPSPPRTCSTRPRRHLDIGSDSQAMGRIGEVIIRTWQTADVTKAARGRCRATARPTTHRARRYVAEYTICPAVARGWRSGRLGGGGQAGRPGAVGPRLLRGAAHVVVKGGMIAWAQRATPTPPSPPAADPAPAHVRGGTGAVGRHQRGLVAQAALDDVGRSPGGRQQLVPVADRRPSARPTSRRTRRRPTSGSTGQLRRDRRRRAHGGAPRQLRWPSAIPVSNPVFVFSFFFFYS